MLVIKMTICNNQHKLHQEETLSGTPEHIFQLKNYLLKYGHEFMAYLPLKKYRRT